MTWHHAAFVAIALASDQLAAALADVLGAAGAADSRARLLKAAALLVQHAPSRSCEQQGLPEDLQPLLRYLTLQLGCAARVQLAALQCQQAAAAAAPASLLLREQVRPLLPLLPKLAAAVRDAATQCLPALAQLVCTALNAVLELCVLVLGQQYAETIRVGPFGLNQQRAVAGPAACGREMDAAAALWSDIAAAVQALPLLADAEAAALQPGFDAAAAAPQPGDAESAVARKLEGELGTAAMNVMTLLHVAAAEAQCAAQLAEMAVIAPSVVVCKAVWQLHSAACRLVRWARADHRFVVLLASHVQGAPVSHTAVSRPMCIQRLFLDLLWSAMWLHHLSPAADVR